MNINFDTLWMMLKFAGMMLGILMLVFVIAAVTPKLAKLFDKRSKPSPARVEDGVKGIYDPQIESAPEEGKQENENNDTKTERK